MVNLNNEILQEYNRDLLTVKVPISRIKVRALIKCEDQYLFIKRTRPGKIRHYMAFPGGRVKNSDRPVIKDKFDRKHLPEEHDQEILFYVEVGSYSWEERTGKEFFNPNKGTYELVTLKTEDITEENIGKKGLRLKPKIWLKLLIKLFDDQNPI